MNILRREKRIVVASGREIQTIVYADSPNEFFVVRGVKGISGPFDLDDKRFQLAETICDFK